MKETDRKKCFIGVVLCLTQLDMDFFFSRNEAKCLVLYSAVLLLQPDELTSLLLVMLYDLQDREFEARVTSSEEEPIAEVREIENFLFRYMY